MRDIIQRTSLISSAIVVAIAIAVPSGSADAAIRCKKGYQLVSGNEIATPYCQDEYLAQVAREYGSPATGAKIRNNPNYKREVCRLVGRDIRVSTTCVDELPSSGRRF
jgi:hypothetical protein